MAKDKDKLREDAILRMKEHNGVETFLIHQALKMGVCEVNIYPVPEIVPGSLHASCFGDERGRNYYLNPNFNKFSQLEDCMKPNKRAEFKSELDEAGSDQFGIGVNPDLNNLDSVLAKIPFKSAKQATIVLKELDSIVGDKNVQLYVFADLFSQIGVSSNQMYEFLRKHISGTTELEKQFTSLFDCINSYFEKNAGVKLSCGAEIWKNDKKQEIGVLPQIKKLQNSALNPTIMEITNVQGVPLEVITAFKTGNTQKIEGKFLSQIEFFVFNNEIYGQNIPSEEKAKEKNDGHYSFGLCANLSDEIKKFMATEDYRLKMALPFSLVKTTPCIGQIGHNIAPISNLMPFRISLDHFIAMSNGTGDMDTELYIAKKQNDGRFRVKIMIESNWNYINRKNDTPASEYVAGELILENALNRPIVNLKPDQE